MLHWRADKQTVCHLYLLVKVFETGIRDKGIEGADSLIELSIQNFVKHCHHF